MTDRRRRSENIKRLIHCWFWCFFFLKMGFVDKNNTPLFQCDHQRIGVILLHNIAFYSLRTGSHRLPVMLTDLNSHHGYKDLMSWRYIRLLFNVFSCTFKTHTIYK